MLLLNDTSNVICIIGLWATFSLISLLLGEKTCKVWVVFVFNTFELPVNEEADNRRCHIIDEVVDGEYKTSAYIPWRTYIPTVLNSELLVVLTCRGNTPAMSHT